jgi:hypothetical protein
MVIQAAMQAIETAARGMGPAVQSYLRTAKTGDVAYTRLLRETIDRAGRQQGQRLRITARQITAQILATDEQTPSSSVGPGSLGESSLSSRGGETRERVSYPGPDRRQKLDASQQTPFAGLPSGERPDLLTAGVLDPRPPGREEDGADLCTPARNVPQSVGQSVGQGFNTGLSTVHNSPQGLLEGPGGSVARAGVRRRAARRLDDTYRKV